MKRISLQTYAASLRKKILSGVDISGLLEINREKSEILNQVKKNPRSYIQSIPEKFAYFFCDRLNLLDKRYIKHEKKITDNVPWTKHYENFHAYVKRECENKKAGEIKQELIQTLPPWFEQISEIMVHGKQKQKAILGFKFFLEDEKLERLIENYKILRKFHSKYDCLFSPGSFFFRYKFIKGKMIYQINHALGNLPPVKAEKYLKDIFSNKKNTFHRLLAEDEYAEAMKALNDFQRKNPEGRGVFWNLDSIVLSVIREYFPEMDTEPKVCWFDKYTTRKLAHYDFSRDEIGFSLIFDLPDINKEILHYLSFHELIHRKLGIEITKSTVRAHTSEFRRIEKSYPDFVFLDKELSRYSRGDFISLPKTRRISSLF